MCSTVILRRPDHRWPLIFAGNRDEMRERPWRAPGRHWSERPEVVAGLDELSGGSWLGLNDWGVMAAVLNRRGSLGADPKKRSRGELVLEALDHAEARKAAVALADLDPSAYRSFNLVVADNRNAFWIRNPGEEESGGEGAGRVAVQPIPQGLSMLTAGDLDDASSPRIRRYLDRFRAAPVPDPDRDDWQAWQDLLADRSHDVEEGPTSAMCFETSGGFATISSGLIALPAPPATLEEEPRGPVFLFADGPPSSAPYRRIAA